jgi:cystathionine gamma-lyase
MRLCDLERVSAIARRHRITLVVDNTFASPVFQNPLAYGADIVVHSTTKYLNGHSDSVGGAIMLNDKEMFDRLKFTQNSAGLILSPFDSFLVLRGTKSLAVRMREHEKNAFQIASWLEGHSAVRRVYYPGLRSHPQHELAKRQMSGFGGMVSFALSGGLREARTFLERLRVFSLAESLGGVESLIEHPISMTHASVPRQELEKLGIGDALIRVSVGIEHPDDLFADIAQALDAVQ